MSIRVRCWILAMCLGFGLVVPTTLRAQTYSVIHNFTGGSDGAAPYSGVTIDRAGNLYGTTTGGGSGHGTVYELKLRNGNYTLNPLYLFPGGAGGAVPYARVVFGPEGLLYGTTTAGGNGNGVVFRLQPRASPCASPLCSWNATVLFAFPANGSGGGVPPNDDVVFDPAGNMYGTADIGGADNYGVVWKLTPPAPWSETVLASFTGPSGSNPGHYPDGGVILDSSGNLYGTTFNGGTHTDGVVYQLVESSGAWSENVLHNFADGADGSNPNAGVIFDASGNLYGATSEGGTGGGGTLFELSPAGGSWSFATLHSFPGSGGCANDTGPGPLEALTMDSAGNLYGATCADGANHRGNIFKYNVPSSEYTDLYDFTGGTDGAYPISNAVCDSEGNLYGTTSQGGTDGRGVVWKMSGVDCLPTDGPLFHR